MHYHGWPSDLFLRVCERSYSWSWNYATVTTIRRREQCKIFQSSSGGGTSKVVWNLLAFGLHKSADSSLSKIVFQQTNTIVKCWEVTKVIISRKKRSLCSAKTLLSGLFTRSANNENIATICASSPSEVDYKTFKWRAKGWAGQSYSPMTMAQWHPSLLYVLPYVEQFEFNYLPSV